MRLFIGSDVLSDYTDGMIVVAAESEDRIVEIVRQELPYTDPSLYRFGEWVDHGEIDGPERVLDYRYGGG
jgi:hypothetical protein